MSSIETQPSFVASQFLVKNRRLATPWATILLDDVLGSAILMDRGFVGAKIAPSVGHGCKESK
jgi:hypothetical protein